MGKKKKKNTVGRVDGEDPNIDIDANNEDADKNKDATESTTKNIVQGFTQEELDEMAREAAEARLKATTTKTKKKKKKKKRKPKVLQNQEVQPVVEPEKETVIVPSPKLELDDVKKNHIFSSVDSPKMEKHEQAVDEKIKSPSNKKKKRRRKKKKKSVPDSIV